MGCQEWTQWSSGGMIMASAGTQYLDVQDRTNGVWQSICTNDFGQVLDYLSLNVSGMTDTFEKDRFASRLASIPGIQPMPSIGDWILLQVEQPAELARRVNRRMEPGVMSVPRNLSGAVRIHVGDPKDNERLLKTLRDLVA